jgi:hypothetical protein
LRISGLLPIIGPESAVLAQLAPERLDFAQRFLALDDLVEQDFQPLDVDRLGQVVVGASFIASTAVSTVPCAVSSSVVTSAPCDCSARSSSSPSIRGITRSDDHDRRTERRDLLERFFAVDGRFGEEAPALDELFQPTRAARRLRQSTHRSETAGAVSGRTISFAATLIGRPRQGPCHFCILSATARLCKLILPWNVRIFEHFSWRKPCTHSSSGTLLEDDYASADTSNPVRRGGHARHRVRPASAPVASDRAERPDDGCGRRLE